MGEDGKREQEENGRKAEAWVKKKMATTNEWKGGGIYIFLPTASIKYYSIILLPSIEFANQLAPTRGNWCYPWHIQMEERLRVERIITWVLKCELSTIFLKCEIKAWIRSSLSQKLHGGPVLIHRDVFLDLQPT